MKTKIRWSGDEYVVLTTHMVGFILQTWGGRKHNGGGVPTISGSVWIAAVKHAQMQLPANRRRNIQFHSMVPNGVKSAVLAELSSGQKARPFDLEKEETPKPAAAPVTTQPLDAVQDFLVAVLVKAALGIIKAPEFRLLVQGRAVAAEDVAGAKEVLSHSNGNGAKNPEDDKVSVLVVGIPDHARPNLLKGHPNLRLKFWDSGESTILIDKMSWAKNVVAVLPLSERIVNTLKSTRKDVLWARAGMESVGQILGQMK